MRYVWSAFVLVISLILAPFVMLFQLLFDRKGLQAILADAQRDWLSDKRHIHRIQFEAVETTPMVEALEDVQYDVAVMVANQDYLGLSDYLRKLDQDRAKCPSQRSLSIEALRHFADLAHIEGNVGVETEDGLPARLEAKYAMHPNDYPLAAMTAMLRLREAWAARGDGYANRVSKRNWAIATNRAQKAERVLSRVNPTELGSPLLAYTQFQLLPFVMDAERKFLPYYHVWTNLDPICQLPHEEVGFKLLPRWFGDLETVEETARHAAEQTSDLVGMAPYYTMFREAVGCDPIQLVIDPELYIQGARDLLTLRNNDPAAVAAIFGQITLAAAWDVPSQASPEQAEKWGETNAKLNAFADEILAERMTKIFISGWDDGVNGALNQISRRFREEMDAGCHFAMGPNGITVLPPVQEPLPA